MFRQNISPGAVLTDMLKNIVKSKAIVDKIPTLKEKDISDAVMYALGTPQSVEVCEKIISRNTFVISSI